MLAAPLSATTVAVAVVVGAAAAAAMAMAMGMPLLFQASDRSTHKSSVHIHQDVLCVKRADVDVRLEHSCRIRCVLFMFPVSERERERERESAARV